MVSARGAIGVAALTTTLLLAWQVSRRSADHVVAAGFWFDAVTFEAPPLDAGHRPRHRSRGRARAGAPDPAAR